MSVRYLSAPAAAEYLGVSTRTFYDHVRRHVATVRIGSRALFDAADLDAYAASRKVEPHHPQSESCTPATKIVRPAPVRLGKHVPNVSLSPTAPKRTCRDFLKKLQEQGKSK
jgi:excisionase family DNA binding protein